MINLVYMVISIAFTFFTFLLSIKIHRLWPSPLTIPIFLSSSALIFTLWITDIPYETYAEGTEIITYMLGPATVALAYPLYQFRGILVRNWKPIISGILIGSAVSMVTSYFLGVFMNIPQDINRSLLVKTITTPVALDIGRLIGAKIELIPAIVIITGISGAMFLPFLLNMLNIRHPIARGLPFGVISHGIGTAQAYKEGEREAAVSGAAMALTAVITSIVIPILFLFV
ncbi:LrgB family protein [Rossellomorea aquimaris]|uniref:LrgB family protein n=1 Tax=Rossellomorea aquimaris TaxID=189382 RepID=UPI001CD4294B|nr:LrgB family protein [Rossellomorea aquimaris]MCA1053814.1 LrgB family protein [Rossellomorea aquimaris]